MNFVFVESQNYSKSLIGLLLLDFPEAKVAFGGGRLEEAEEFFKTYRPKPGEKNIIITAGTIDSYYDPAGSAFDLVTKWLNDLRVALEREGKLETFKPDDIAVVANPSFESRSEDGFSPFKSLQEACLTSRVPLLIHPKTKGPEELLQIINGLDPELRPDFPGRRK